MGLVKHILFHNFWSFLLVLSGIVDIALGIISYLTGALTAKNSSLPTFAICFIVGFIYLSAGIVIATIKLRKQKP